MDHHANLVTALLLTSFGMAQAGWSMPLRVSNEPWRSGFWITYNPDLERAVVLSTPKDGRNKFSEWDGVRWFSTDTLGPRILAGSIAYHPLRKTVVALIRTTNALETWEWDGRTFTPVPGTMPNLRYPGQLAFHHKRGTLIHYGGFDLFGDIGNETWEWDGQDWQLLPTPSSPPTKVGFYTHAYQLVYDENRDRALLFGGRHAPGEVEIWELGTGGWTRIPVANSVPNYFYSVFVFDPIADRVVFYGRSFQSGSETSQEWDGTRWTPSRSGFPTVASSRGCFDKARGEVVVFGLSRVNTWTTETWVYRSAFPAGGVATFGQGCGNPAVTLNVTTGTRPRIGGVLSLDVQNLPPSSSLGLMSIGLSNQRIGGSQLPLDLTPFGMTGCQLYHSFDLARPFSVAAGRGNFTVPVPAEPSLRGARVYFQAAAGIVASNGATVIIGY